jgi:uncharacterized membrane protein YhaH (DUF805 family)
MFKNPFSFEGRIRRSEYGLSVIIFWVTHFIILPMTGVDEPSGFQIIVLAYIPVIWLSLAQGAKRCHDLDKSGWWQIIPFYELWMLFQDGLPGTNEYGDNPKGLVYPIAPFTPEPKAPLVTDKDSSE